MKKEEYTNEDILDLMTMYTSLILAVMGALAYIINPKGTENLILALILLLCAVYLLFTDSYKANKKKIDKKRDVIEEL